MISLHLLLIGITTAYALESIEGPRFIRKTLRFPSKNLRVTRNNNNNNNAEDNPFSNSEDLLPLAQSYFIIPETPSTTTVKPVFTRRKTSINLTKNEPKSIINEDVDTSSTSTTSNYNPFRQIMDTGFQHGASKKTQTLHRRPSVNLMMMRREYVNEGSGGANINEGSRSAAVSDNKKEPVVERQNQEQGNAKYGRRKYKKVEDNTQNEVPSSTLPPRQHRFSPQKRNFARKNEDVTNSSPSPSPSPSTAPIIGGRGSSRSGRQFGAAKRKVVEIPKEEKVKEILATPASENKRRRRKFSTSTISNSLNNDENNSSPAPVSQRDAELKRINSNLFASRRTFVRKPSAESIPTLNPVESVQDSVPLNRRVNRHRPAPVLAPLSNDSEQQSSDTITILADSPEVTKAESNDDGETKKDNPDAILPSFAPRNLSNRRQSSGNALDKLNNRQASARRFLTPKKPAVEGQDGEAFQPTTKAPLSITTSRAPRKSPLSLANLRNRRLGHPVITTSTTEAPFEEEGNLEALSEVENGTVSVVVTNVVTNSTDAILLSENYEDVVKEKPVEEKSPLAGLLRNRRPPIRLPGSRAQVGGTSPIIKPRGSVLKPKTTEATTVNPINVETTTLPTCEEGKRYNKILRKCIPSFNAKAG